MDFNAIINAAFDSAVAAATAPLVERIAALEAANLEERESNQVPSARVDALYTLLSTLIETSDEAVEIAKEEQVPGLTPKFRLRESLVHFIKEQAISADEEQADFDRRVVDAIEAESRAVAKIIEGELSDETPEGVKAAVERCLNNGSFDITFNTGY